ncbi:MAG: chorismate synthase [Anaerotruncus massiliensis (ex Togo et al. 2019)]
MLGGISSGMPILLRAAFKPTASIAKPQRTVDFQKTPAGAGRQGPARPCVVVRAVPVVEAAVSLALADALLGARATRASEPEMTPFPADISC